MVSVGEEMSFPRCSGQFGFMQYNLMYTLVNPSAVSLKSHTFAEMVRSEMLVT